MSKILQRLGFIPLKEFIAKNIGVDVEADKIFIKCTDSFVKYPTERIFSNTELLNIVLDKAGKDSQVCNGYDKSSKQWFKTNTTRNILKTHKWAKIFDAIGDENSIFILTKCHIIEEANENLILVSGDFNELKEQNAPKKYVTRERLFYGKTALPKPEIEQVLIFIYQSLPFRDIKITEAIVNSIVKFNKIKMTTLFHSFFKNQPSTQPLSPEDCSFIGTKHGDNYAEHCIKKSEVAYEKIIDFLFLISKKFLNPIFNFEDFKTLKGKLALLIKRNILENISMTELKKHISVAKLKLFKNSNIQYSDKLLIAENLLLFLFNNIFIDIVAYYFYSTQFCDSRHKLCFFYRNEWNKATSLFFKDYLTRFEVAAPKLIVGTLRCIPKPDGFRVVTNCSGKNSKTAPAVAKTCSKTSIEVAKKLTMQRNKAKFNNINAQFTQMMPVFKKEFLDYFGNSLLCHKDIHQKLYRYLSCREQRMFVFKIDLKKCFDNIPQDGLINIVKEIFKEKFYNFLEYKLLCENEKSNKLEVKSLRLAPDLLFPVNKVEKIAYRHVDEFVMKENRQKTFTRDEILNSLSDLIGNTVIFHHNKYFRMKTGIPQGCSVSSMLCNLYLGRIDKEYFAEIFKEGMMCRYVDDFLIVTPNVDEVNSFFKVAKELRSKGVIINTDKIEANIEFDINKPIDTTDIKFTKSYITWCGMKIYDKGIAVKNTYDEKHFRYQIALPRSSQGRDIKLKIKRVVEIRASKLYLSWKNRLFAQNIFELFFLVGRRARILFLRADFVNRKFVDSILNEAIKHVKRVLKEYKNRLYDEKIDQIAHTAYMSSGALKFKAKKWE